jgi:hypothetical protein
VSNKMEDLIAKLIKLESVWYANYYASCMKKLPHGGIAHVFKPNYYLKYFPKQLSRLFVQNPETIAYFMEPAVEEVYVLIKEANFDMETILNYFCESDFWYVGFRILKPKAEYKGQDTLFFSVVENNLKFKDFFEINEKIVIYAFLCYLIDCNKVKVLGLEDIEQHEELIYDHNKYGLSNITFAEFRRQGFIFDNKYFLYNIFFDTSISSSFSEVPSTIQIIFSEVNQPKFEMRLDNKLAVPVSKMVTTATVDAQVFRGIQLNFADINRLVNRKEIIVHFDPDTMNKVVMIIKEDNDNGEPFFHIEIEELWNPDYVNDDLVLLNFIHAKYYPATNSFNHIDFSVNQYSKSVYSDKFTDNPNITGISIDRYCDIHYKIWCVEARFIPIETWSKLVVNTLDEPFRDLFFEMFTQEQV